MLYHAQDLKLYVKIGDDYELTDEGRRVTLERQNMSAVEVRELIRQTMRDQTDLKIESESERAPTVFDILSQAQREFEPLNMNNFQNDDKLTIIKVNDNHENSAFIINDEQTLNPSGFDDEQFYDAINFNPALEMSNVKVKKGRGRPRKDDFLRVNKQDVSVTPEERALMYRQSKKRQLL